jgi:hypothetical protein
MANEIDALNRGLRRTGQPVTLRKVTGTTSQTFTDVVCQAVVRGYTPTELIAGSGIIQQDSKVILSPTEINAAVWPSAQVNGQPDVRIPSKNRGDIIRINGKDRFVQAGVGIYSPNNVLWRIEVQVR